MVDYLWICSLSGLTHPQPKLFTLTWATYALQAAAFCFFLTFYVPTTQARKANHKSESQFPWCPLTATGLCLWETWETTNHHLNHHGHHSQVFALDKPEQLGGRETRIADLVFYNWHDNIIPNVEKYMTIAQVLKSKLTTSKWGDQHLFFR